jgi:hypothetical protein
MKKIFLHIMLFFSCLCFVAKLSAQDWLTMDMNRSVEQMIVQSALKDTIPQHLSISPYRLSETDSLANRFSSLKYSNDPFFIRFYPNFNLGAGLQENNKFISSNDIGFYTDIRYKANEHFLGLHLGASLYAGLEPYYMRLRIDDRQIIPGLWVVDKINNTWNLAWLPDISLYYLTPWFVYLETGIGKQQIGNGYRSMILSENAPAYPFARMGAEFTNIHYIFQWSWLNIADNQPWVEKDANKYMMMHYLSWNIGKRLSLGMFESIVWSNAANRRAFEAQYLNPFIFYRPVEFSLGSSDNALMGLDMSFKISENLLLYGQFILDDIQIKELINDIKYRVGILDGSTVHGWFGNKYGGQIGFKYFNVFGLENLYLQSEMNAVRPATYAHNNVNQSYTSYYQSMAHPLGANFIESFSTIAYRYKNWKFMLDYMYALQGISSTDNYLGDNIFYPVTDGSGHDWYPIPTYGNVILQGNRTKIQYLVFDLSWQPFPNGLLELYSKVFYRQQEILGKDVNDFGVMLGARTHFGHRKEMF